MREGMRGACASKQKEHGARTWRAGDMTVAGPGVLRQQASRGRQTLAGHFAKGERAGGQRLPTEEPTASDNSPSESEAPIGTGLTQTGADSASHLKHQSVPV